MSNQKFQANLAPILVSLLAILSVSLFGSVVVHWPQEPPRPQGQGVEGSTPQSFDGESSFVPPANEPGRTKWM